VDSATLHGVPAAEADSNPRPLALQPTDKRGQQQGEQHVLESGVGLIIFLLLFDVRDTRQSNLDIGQFLSY